MFPPWYQGIFSLVLYAQCHCLSWNANWFICVHSGKFDLGSMTIHTSTVAVGWNNPLKSRNNRHYISSLSTLSNEVIDYQEVPRRLVIENGVSDERTG